ncbi:MAG TPA: WD40 repeat domain-containing protein, partial [Anaerolineales bacterium]|nr:WD40 repeat domain-containing protein [Anaerolineales bacterium]
MQTNIAKSRKNRILLFILTLVMLILTGVVFRRTWLNEQNTATLTSQLATAQAVGWETELLREQAVLKTDISRSRELAAQSSVADEQNAALKVLLAVESLKALKGVDTSNQYPLWTHQALYDSLSNIGGLPLTGQYGIIDNVAFSPDGKWLATAGHDATIFLWNVHNLSDKPIILRWGEFPGFSELAFSPDGKWLAAGRRNPAGEKIVLLWDVNDLSTPPLTLVGKQGWVTSLVFSPDGRWLAVVDGTDATLSLWDMQDLAAQPIALGGGAYSLAFSSDDRWLAVKGNDGCILWNVQDLTAKPLALKNCGLNPSFSSDGRWLAATEGGTIRLWNMKNPTSNSITLKERLGYYPGLAFSPDGKWLAASGQGDRTVRLWD